MPRQPERFDPRAILGALERNRVDYVLIGGLAQVIRGADITTTSVDICPSFGPGNLERLAAAAAELGATASDGRAVELTDATIGAEPVVSLTTVAGALRVIGSPAGAPRGFVDLRRGASKEHLGHGVQPQVAAVGDLARLASALRRPHDVDRLAQLRRIVELEVDRDQTPVGSTEPARQSSRRASRGARRLTR
jgi:hypothetical protein